MLFWHSLPGTFLLYGAASIHVSLALLAVYDRRTLRMSPVQGLRIVLGLTMPIVLIGHFVGTRYAFEHFGLAAEYRRVVAGLWATSGQGRQMALLAPGWLHGCLGLRYAFSSRPYWKRLRFVLFAIALLLPVLAGLGFMTMGRDIARETDVSQALRESMSAAQGNALGDARETVLAFYGGIIGLVFGARLVRDTYARHRGTTVKIKYPQREVEVPRGWTVLEASRSFGIAHQSMCGGRARCSTCRVRVTAGRSHCAEPRADERRTLEAIGAPDDVRLACQLRPMGDIAISLLMAVEQPLWRDATLARPSVDGDAVLLYARLVVRRDPAAPDKLAHEEIHAFEGFQAIVTQAVADGGGMVCHSSRPEPLALFSARDGSLQFAGEQALGAARRIEREVRALLTRLGDELGFQADHAVALHAGRVVWSAASEGRGGAVVVGAAVREGQCLTDLALNHGLALVISEPAAHSMGADSQTLEWRRPVNAAKGTNAALSFAAFPIAK